MDDDLPPRRSRWLPLLGLFAVAAGVLLLRESLLESGRHGGDHPAVGKPLSKIQLAPCANTDQPLSSEALQDKVVLINFWGTWCPPCREELPHVVELQRKFRENERFAFVSVSCSASGEDSPAQVGPETRQFLTAEKYEFPVYCDPEAMTRGPLAISLKLDGFGYPTTVVADRTGTIRGMWVGYRQGDEKAVESLVASLLK
jgi:cytochrome c biogenesis protein CcmG/thiol:disulfide interchange protein DsbE